MDAPDLALADEEIVFELEEITDSNDPAWIQAEADYAAGRYATNDQVIEWIRSWGTENELAMPTPWLK